MPARVLMVQGTGSSVGKSLIAAALCRAFAREGLRVLPYKSQNMSNNAVATAEGGEIGRAQALQAAACGVEPRVDMNPILLKPEGDARSQVVLMGRPWKTLAAREYRLEKARLWEAATGALDRLRADCDLVVIEGAGSPAEINLRADEIVNMSVALYAKAPVLLVGDIDPGGVFAQFVGTLALLAPEERELVRGLVINKFRGDIALLEPGLADLRRLTGKPVLGVVPWIRDMGLAEEDGAVLETRRGPAPRGGPAAGSGGGCVAPRAPRAVGGGVLGIGGMVRPAGSGGASPPSTAPDSGSGEAGREIDIAVIRFPRISNFDDFDALSLEPGVSVRFVASAVDLGLPDAVILPGTKSTLADLDWLRESGLDLGIRWLARLGRGVLGVCGGFQMLGHSIEDVEGVEGRPRREEGLGLLPARTIFSGGKRVLRRRGRVAGGLSGALAAAGGLALEGYEIHAGESLVSGPPLFELAADGDLARAGGRAADGGNGASVAGGADGDGTSASAAGGAGAGAGGAGGVWEPDGTWALGGRVMGTYLHGLFDLPGFRRAWLASLGAGSAAIAGSAASAAGSSLFAADRAGWSQGIALAQARDAALDRLADGVSKALDMEALHRIAGL